MQHPAQPSRSVTAVVAFVVTALIASILLISAFVLLLGDILGSHLLAMVILGGVCAIAAWVIYSLRLKPFIERWDKRLTTIFEVAESLRHIYEKSLDYIFTKIFKT